MKVESKALKNCVVKLSVQADAAEVKDLYNGVLKDFVRNARVPGFRPGKAPAEVIKSRFHAEIQRESQGSCVRDLYPKAVKEAGIDPIGLVDVEDLIFAPETGCSFVATVEVKPEFKLPKYKKLAIDRLEVKVGDKEVDERVAQLRAAYAKYEDAAEGASVKGGDFVQIDYKGSVGGKPIAEVAPEAKAVAGSEGFWLQVAEGRFLPELLEALEGMKVGESKTGVKVKFPKEAAPEPLKGAKAEYDLTVKAIRSQILPDDATLVKESKAESIEKLRADLKDSMVKDAERAEEARRRDYAVETLLKKADFDVPESQVREETAAGLRRYAERAQYSGIGADYIEQNREQIMAEAEKTARNQVRLSYILAEIAKEEKLEVTAEELDKRLDAIAMQAGKDREEVRGLVEKAGNMPSLKGQILAEKAIELVLAEAK